MTDDQSDRDIYAWALRESASLRDHRLNCWDKTMFWSAVHRMLTKHSPADGDQCAECAKPWPCGAVQGAVTDLRMGGLGY